MVTPSTSWVSIGSAILLAMFGTLTGHLRRSGFREVDFAPESAVRKGHCPFQPIGLNGETENSPGQITGQDRFGRVIATLDRAHGNGFAVYDFVAPYREP